MAGIALSNESNFWLFYYYDCFEPWRICDDSTAVCSCSVCIGIQCGPDGIRISCWLNRTQADHITPTVSIASMIAHAHRLEMQDQLYPELLTSRLYWSVYLWWVKKHVLHGITECTSIDLRTDGTSTAYYVYTMCMWHLLQRLYTCWLHNKALARMSCICTDPPLSSFALIPELIHLHWLCHGLHPGHNWLQFIAYSSHCRCTICHVIACTSTAWKPLHLQWLHG